MAQPLPGNTREFSLAVHRNHSFELVASTLPVFLAQSGLKADIWYSGYDDSLAFSEAMPEADAHLVWLDGARYRAFPLGPWLERRIGELRKLTRGAIVVGCLGLSTEQAMPMEDSVLFCDIESIVSGLGEKAFDARLQKLSGTRLSNAACLEMSRALGLHYLPSLLAPALKALVLDCDNTLYRGVLGEDGINGVAPFIEVQNRLKTLKGQGFMLALASKNEERDVAELFARRRDFPLQWQDFAARGINWRSKAENILAIANDLNISPDAMLFVDDNPGEILQVSSEIPEIKILEAETPEDTLQGLLHYPGLFKSRTSREDVIRSADVRANARRTVLKNSLSPEAYRRELKISLDFEIDPLGSIGRITELLNKTNQFILNYLRPGQDIVRALMTSKDACVVTASLSDRLSDSGLIAILLARKERSDVRALDLVVSCRALGRGIEGGMILAMLAQAALTLGGERARLSFQSGPRNRPALDWLRTMTPGPLESSGEIIIPVMRLQPDLAGLETNFHGRKPPCPS